MAGSNLNVCDVAWAAGFLDGEGYFGITKAGKGTQRRMTIEAAQVATAEPLHKLSEMFGGAVVWRPSGHPCWVWKIGGRENVRTACMALHPFLIVKRRQAEELLRFAIFTRPRSGPQALRQGYPVPEKLMRAHIEACLLATRKAA